ncbi:MAG: hypothetical protein Q7R52_00855 [archaeon]|nr:hypothetical protein [archaeon]
MINGQLKGLVKKIEENIPEFPSFSRDSQQINPLLRMKSIAGIIPNLKLPPEGSTIIDMGTGYGYGAVALNTLGYKTIGIEQNREKLNVGLKYWNKLGIPFKLTENYEEALRTKENLIFINKKADGFENFPICSIDSVTAFYISLDMATEDGALWSIGKILKPKSRLFVTTEGPIKEVSNKFLDEVILELDKNHPIPRLETESIQKIKDPLVYDKFIITKIKY